MTEASARMAQLLGMRFATDFRVTGVGPGDQVLLQMAGRGTYTISVGELLTIVDSGFVAEVKETGEPNGGDNIQERRH